MKNLIIAFALFIIPSALLSQWSSDSSVNLKISDQSGEQSLPKIALTSDGGCFIAWFDSRSGSYAVYLQRLNAQGVKQFASDGLLISSNPQSSSLVDWDMIADDSNNAVIVFTDTRNGSSINPFAYRVSSQGNFLWGTNGITLSNDFGVFQANPKAVQTSDNNFVITWIYTSTPRKVAMQKISPGGAKLWGNDPIYLSGSGSELFDYPSLVTSDNGSVIAFWCGYTGSFLNPVNYRLYSQKFNQAGNPVWNSTQDTVYSLGRVSGFFVPKIFPDGLNGALYVWQDDRSFTNRSSTFVQRFNSAGVRSFPLNGSEASTTADNNKFDAWAAYMPSTNETYLIWKMSNGLQSQFGVYGQKFSSDGTRQWGNDGKVFQPLGSNSMEKLLCLTKDTSVIYSFNESITGGVNNIIKGFTTDRNGNIGWGGYIHTVSSPSSEKLKLVGIVNSNKMTMLAWSDRRLDGGGIYAQNINSNGTLGNLTGINNISSENPESIILKQNYPNPFNPVTHLEFEISEWGFVSLKVYDVLGNEIKTLVNEYKPAGNYSVTFDAGDTGQGNNLSSGIYFYTLSTGLQKQTRTMLLIK